MVQACAAITAGVASFYLWPVAGFWLAALVVLAAYGLIRVISWPAAKWLFLLFLLAAAWAAVHCYQRLSLQITDEFIGQTVTVQGRVEGLPETSGEVQRFMLRVEPGDSSGQLLTVEAGALLRLSWFRSDATLKPGELWQLPLRLKPPRGMLNFHGFDYERWLFQIGVHGTGYVRGEPKLLANAGGHQSANRIRRNLVQQLQAATRPTTEQGMGLLRALTLGDRSGLTDADWTVLRRTGTSHLVAISGLHIGLVAALVFLLARWLWARTGLLAERIASPRAAAIAAMLAACGYAALAGFSLPTQRALIMLLVAMAALWFRTALRPAAGWWIAAAAVLLWSPVSLLSGGFWLSFLAVAWIIYWLAGRQPRPSGWRFLLQIQLLLAVGLWPITLYFFGSASLISPVINLLAVPLVSAVLVPLALFSIIVLPITTLPAEAFAWLLQQCWQLLNAAASLPVSQWQLTPPLWVVVLAMISAVIVTLPRGMPGIGLGRWAGVPGLCVLLFWQPARLASDELRITQLDVGQGLATLIQTRNHSMLFDGGARYASGFDLGERIVLPELQALNIQQLDLMVASHGDNDHRGGLPAVLAETPAQQILAGGRKVPVWQLNQRPCEAGESWRWNAATFTVLWPFAESYTGEASENDLSCVVLITSDKQRLLLTGDIEYDTEQAILARYPALRASIVQVPHHGSRSSSSEAFIQQLQPTLAVISAGYKNRFRQPHGRVLSRYAAANAQLLRTDTDGAIEITLSASPPVIKTARQQRPGWWRGGR